MKVQGAVLDVECVGIAQGVASADQVFVANASRIDEEYKGS